jgi:hypothetical protein
MRKIGFREGGARAELWPMLVVLFLAALFFLSYFNRFAGIRSGDGEFSGGMAFLRGWLPYRDYYTAGPPLTQLKSAIELALFGKALIVTRACAVVERLAIAALLYIWLRRSFSQWAAAIASLTTIILSAGDHTDPLASYNHDAILLAMLCGFFATLALEKHRAHSFAALSVCAGIMAGLSSLTKQTVGLGVAIGVMVIGALACWHVWGRRRSLFWLAAFGLGFSIPVVALGLYLKHVGLLAACLQMLFVSGPQAKASHPLAFAVREWRVLVDNPTWWSPALLGIAVSARTLWRGLSRDEDSNQTEQRIWLWVLGVGIVLFGIAKLLASTEIHAVRDSAKCTVYYTLVMTAIYGLGAIVFALRERGRLSERAWKIALVATVGWCVAITQSLSWPVFEAMLLPGLGVLVAAVIDGARSWGVRFTMLVVASLSMLQVWEKLDLPFSFKAEDEAPVRMATVESAQPMLRGMRLPAETVRLLDKTVKLMQGHGPVFTYPEMGLLYVLSKENPPTFAGSHNIDVVSDTFMREETARLERTPPAVLLYARPTETELKSEEQVWREGRRSGQRDMIAMLDTLAARYILVDTFVLRTGDDPIRLYMRPEAGTQAGAP